MTLVRVLRNSAVMAIAVAVGARADDVPWTVPGVLDATALGATGVAIGDIDNDGKPDVVAISLSDNTLAWYENGAGARGTFLRHEISAGMQSPQRVQLADIDKDGWLDIVVTCANDGAVRVFFNDKTPGNGGWVSHAWTTGQGQLRGLAIADFDRDGDLDIAFSVPSSGRVAWLENTGSPRTLSATVRNLTAGAGDTANDIAAADLDRDGFPDVVAANGAGGTSGSGVVWWQNDQNPQNGGWTRTVVANGQASPFQCIAARDVSGDGRADLVAGRLDGTVLWYRSTGAGTFIAATMGAGAADPRSIAVGDINGDSSADVAVTSFTGDSVRWFENSGGIAPTFTARTAATGLDGAAAVALGDIDGDGDLDIAAAEFTAGDVSLVFNTKIHSSSKFEPLIVLGTEAFDGSTPYDDLRAVDLDNDGDADVVRVTSNANGDHLYVWYEHDATPFSGAWTRRTVVGPNADLGPQVWPVDADGDGDMDLGGRQHSVLSDDAWGFELGDGTPANGGWSNVSDSATLLNFFRPHGVGDVDLDGAADVLLDHWDLLQSETQLHWSRFRPFDTVKWTRQQIQVDSAPNEVFQLATADLDNDGDRDIVVTGAGSLATSYFENPGSLNGLFTRRAISGAVSSRSKPILADFNGDGRVDVLVYDNGNLSVCLNQGGTPPAFSRVIAADLTANFGFGINDPHAVDMDGDGDLDVLVYANSIPTSDGVNVMECTDRAAQVYTRRPMPAPFGANASLDFADLDRDGLADIVGVSQDDLSHVARFFVVRNRGGQVDVTGGSAVRPGDGIFDGRENVLLTLDVHHLGRTGDHAAEIAGLRVVFERLPGLPLTPDQLSDLFSSVAIFSDVDGDGALTPGVDIEVHRVQLSAHGAANPVPVTITDGLAEAHIPATQTRRYLVTGVLRPTAHAAALNQFIAVVRLDEDNGTPGVDMEDAGADLPLRLAHSADARTGVVTALCPADFNGDGFLDFFDIDAFTSCFDGQECPDVNPGIDFNGDGFVDFFDADQFTQSFEIGC